MKPTYIYLIYYRAGDGEILKYITTSPELHRIELERLREEGREIVRDYRLRI